MAPFPLSSSPGAIPGEGSGRLVNALALKDGADARWFPVPGLAAVAAPGVGIPRGGLLVGDALLLARQDRLLGSVLDKASTGALAPAQSTVVGFAQALGIPNETIAKLGLNPQEAVTSQVATKITNELVTGMIGGGGFPANNFSDADRNFLQDIFPKMSNRPEANRMAVDVLKRVQQRNLEVGDAWAEYQQAQRAAGKPSSVAEFEYQFRKGLRDRPDLFGDVRQQVDALQTGEPQARDGRQAPAQQSGAVPAAPAIGTVSKGHRYTGGDPASPSSWERIQ